MAERDQKPLKTSSVSSTFTSHIDSHIAPSVLPSSLHTQVDRLALQIQHNGGNGRIVLTLMHGKVCMIDQESNMTLGECYQMI